MRHPEAGLLLGGVAFFFDTGVYINDIFTSGFDRDVINKVATSTMRNSTSVAVDNMAYGGMFGDISKAIGYINSGLTIRGGASVNILINKIKNKIKECIDEQKKKRAKKYE